MQAYMHSLPIQMLRLSAGELRMDREHTWNDAHS